VAAQKSGRACNEAFHGSVVSDRSSVVGNQLPAKLT